jgi:hypothetical protein
MLEQFANDYPWLKRITAKAHQNVWKFFTDASIWGRMPPQLLIVEVRPERDQLGSRSGQSASHCRPVLRTCSTARVCQHIPSLKEVKSKTGLLFEGRQEAHTYANDYTNPARLAAR